MSVIVTTLLQGLLVMFLAQEFFHLSCRCSENVKARLKSEPQEISSSRVGDASEESVDFILDYTKDAPKLQFDDSDKLDSKMFSIFAAATVTAGLAARIPSTNGRQDFTESLFYFSLLSYVIVLGTAVLHVSTNRHRRSAQAGTLWEHHRDKSPDRLKRILARDISAAYKYNAPVLARKARTVNLAVRVTGLQAVLTIAAFIASR